ncbi:hypothetical protein FTK93_09380 [Campylobacter jejuni]|nr:hypothetical protein [Campylobacter jejuni]ECL6242428.1 hypothetical protein [Campylobacter jejuni]ECL6376113.1 hypothetical protein [Campylobacter jejuni]ECL6376198.1 hypothetical protein [Campylobacter jejuni]ECL6512868.1 hypothetical protein [Campylobacter jejuni]
MYLRNRRFSSNGHFNLLYGQNYLRYKRVTNSSLSVRRKRCKKCGEKIYVEFQPNEKFIFKCPNCSRKNRKVFYAF